MNARLALLFVLSCGAPTATTCPPCTGEIPPVCPSAVAAIDAGVARDASASGDVVVAQGGELVVVRRVVRTNTSYVAKSESAEVQLDGLEETASPSFRLVDVNGDGAIDIVADTQKGTAASERFRAYEGIASTHLVDGTPDEFAWRAMLGAADLDAAVAALTKTPRTDFSVPEACGAIDRATKPVETWEAPSASPRVWTLAKKKQALSGFCGTLMRDGPSAYWMPELRCGTFVPACEADLISGGHGGTILPSEKLVYFERVQGKLEVRALAVTAN